MGHVACMEEIKNAYKILVRRLKGRDHFEDLGVNERIIWSKMDLRETEWEGVDWIHLV